MTIKHYPNGFWWVGWQMMVRKPGWYRCYSNGSRVGPYVSFEEASKA